MSYLAVKMAPVRDVDFGEARTHEHRGKTSTLRLDYKYDTILTRALLGGGRLNAPPPPQVFRG